MKEVQPVSPNDLGQALDNITNRYWRLNNLYQIVDKRGKQVTFKMNWAQQELYKNLWYCNIVLKARQLGMSTFISILFLDECLFNSNVHCGQICHTLEDAKILFRRVKFAYDNLNPMLKNTITATSDSARELSFSNGSSIRVGTSMRSSTLHMLHVSEFGKICAHYPEKAQEIITGSLNTLASGKYCFIESTAEGRDGYFYDMCRKSQNDALEGRKLNKLMFKFHFFPWWECPDYTLDDKVETSDKEAGYFALLEEKDIELTEGQKSWYTEKSRTLHDEIKQEYPSTPEEAFESAIQGAYYADQMLKVRMEERITKVPYEEDLPVHTAWDLGFGDNTSIWWFQIYGTEIRLLEYVEGNQKSLIEWIKIVKDKPYTYGKHLAPHDIAVKEYGDGISRIHRAAKHGINFIKVDKDSVDDGIDAVRNILKFCWFDEVKCHDGVACLDGYKRKWLESSGTWAREPAHNYASHGADAFRMLAVGYKRMMEKEIDDNQYEQLIDQFNPRFS